MVIPSCSVPQFFYLLSYTNWSMLLLNLWQRSGKAFLMLA